MNVRRGLVLFWTILLGALLIGYAQEKLDFSKVKLKFSMRIAQDASKTAMDSLSGVFKLRKSGEVKLIMNKSSDDSRFYYQELMRADLTSPDTLSIFYVNRNAKQTMSSQGANFVKPYVTLASDMRTTYRLDSIILRPKKGLFRLKMENKDSVVFNRVYYAIDSLLCVLHYTDKNLVEHAVVLNNPDSLHFPAPIYRLNKVVLVNTLDSTEVKCGNCYLATSSRMNRTFDPLRKDSEFNKRNVQEAMSKTMTSTLIGFYPKTIWPFLPRVYVRNWPFEETAQKNEEE